MEGLGTLDILPREIRDRIWHLAYGESRVHVTASPYFGSEINQRRYLYHLCPLKASPEQACLWFRRSAATGVDS